MREIIIRVALTIIVIVTVSWLLYSFVWLLDQNVLCSRNNQHFLITLQGCY